MNRIVLLLWSGASAVVLTLMVNATAWWHCDWLSRRLNVLTRGTLRVEDTTLSHVEAVYEALCLFPVAPGRSWMADGRGFEEQIDEAGTVAVLGGLRFPPMQDPANAGALLAAALALFGAAYVASRAGRRSMPLMLRAPLMASRAGPSWRRHASACAVGAVQALVLPLLCLGLTYDISGLANPAASLGIPYAALALLAVMTFALHLALAGASAARSTLMSEFTQGACPACTYPLPAPGASCPECGWGRVPAVGAARLLLTGTALIVALSIIGAVSITAVKRALATTDESLTLMMVRGGDTTLDGSLLIPTSGAYHVDLGNAEVLVILGQDSNQVRSTGVFARGSGAGQWKFIGDINRMSLGVPAALLESGFPWVARSDVVSAGGPAVRFSSCARGLRRVTVEEARSLLDAATSP